MALADLTLRLNQRPNSGLNKLAGLGRSLVLLFVLAVAGSCLAQSPAAPGGFAAAGAELGVSGPASGKPALAGAGVQNQAPPAGSGTPARVSLTTLALVSGLASFLQAVAFVVLWRLNPGIRGIGYWAGSAVANATAQPIFALQATSSSLLLTAFLPTCLSVLALTLFYAGAAALVGRPPRWRFLVVAGVPLFLGYVWFLVAGNIPLRLMFMALLTAIYLGMVARKMFAERRRGLRFSASLCGAATAGMSALMVLRAVLLPFQGPIGSSLSNVPAQIMMFVGLTIWLMAWGFGAVLLINQRHLYENEQQHQRQLATEAALQATQQELEVERAHRRRRQLLRDLHDGLGGVTAQIAMLTSAEGATTESEASERLRHLDDLAAMGHRELRALMNYLESGSAYWGDVISELREHALRVTAARNITLDWRICSQVPEAAIPEIAAVLSLSRALKEAVNNLVRHSGSTRATVRFSFRPQRLWVLVRDNGCGLDGQPPSLEGGRGLGNMRHRVEELGGSLALVTRRGLRLLFTVPLPLQASEIALATATPADHNSNRGAANNR